MVPPPASSGATAARRQGASQVAGSPRRAGRGTEAPFTRRAPLRVVPTRSRRGIRGGRAGAGRGKWLTVISVSMVVAALLAVVVGQAFLANGQVRLSALQHQLTMEQSAHRQAELAVSQLETPARIVGAASGQLHMVRPDSVVELPYVSLSVPLPTPKVTPAPVPAPPPPTTSPAGAGASAVTGSGSPPSASSSTSTPTSSSAATTTPTSTP
jgi:hypothetical protein